MKIPTLGTPRFSAIASGKRLQEIETLVKTHVKEMPLDFCLEYKPKPGWWNQLCLFLEQRRDRKIVRNKIFQRYREAARTHSAPNNMLSIVTLINHSALFNKETPPVLAAAFLDEGVQVANQSKPAFGVHFQKFFRVPDTLNVLTVVYRHLRVS